MATKRRKNPRDLSTKELFKILAKVDPLAFTKDQLLAVLNSIPSIALSNAVEDSGLDEDIAVPYLKRQGLDMRWHSWNP